MAYKDSLNQAKEKVNLALLKLRQSYSRAASSKTIFLVLEGKDDVTYYGTKIEDYIPNGWNIKLIPAGNRSKAVSLYRAIDWTVYSKKRIMFFIDRDLSDYTDEDTPSDINVYVTQKYAIENELCTYDTFLKTLKYYYGLNDIEENDECLLKQLYDSWWTSFCTVADPIMAQILFWKTNHIDSNYSNFKIQKVFDIHNNLLLRNSTFSTVEEIMQELAKDSGVEYCPIDTSVYMAVLNGKLSPEAYIRGKYILAFFVKALLYVSKNSAEILQSKIVARPTISLGYEDAISKLCGIMRTPESLRTFWTTAFSDLHQECAEFSK